MKLQTKSNKVLKQIIADFLFLWYYLNNKDCIKYLKIEDTSWGNVKSELYRYITFYKRTKTYVDFKAISYVINVENKRVCNLRLFDISDELLDAINEQFVELKK